MFRQPFRMRASICAALIVLLSVVLACPTAHAQCARTKGEQVVDAQGHGIHLRGINLGNWMVPEGYMWQFGGHMQSAREIRGTRDRTDRH
jgi:endoglucanase